jgi:outer membrane protein assembly factor BamA
MYRYLFVIFLILTVLPEIQAQEVASTEQIRIDSIVLIKNWRTKDRIIREEMGFWQGDIITRSAIDTAMIRVWNIGNFARVEYQLDTFGHQQNLLTITAQDALTVFNEHD